MMRLFTLVFVTILTTLAAGNVLERSQKPAENDCKTIMDFIIVLDSSGSIGSLAFEQAKAALIELVSSMQIGPKKVQVWAINYGQTVEVPIAFHNMPMSEFTKAKLIQQIKNIRYMNGPCTATGDALKEARQICGDKCRRLSEGASRVALVLTDGNSNCGASVGVESTNLLHITKVSVFAVGIGAAINNAELHAIATDKKYVMHVSNYLNLSAAINSITVQTCGIPAFVIPNVKVESEVPSNTFRYYQLDTTEFHQKRNNQGGFIEITATILLGKVEVFTSTTDTNPGSNTGKHVQFQTRGTQQYYIEYIEENTPRLYFSFFGVQATNEYDFVVNWLDESGVLIG
ncbi:unnamed protein product [Rotaria magnacalcarata]|uniref:VWFA domain-containing protein n=1 Tax=Rotaria magnacalcarata TaxID=392030 RepID=A0A820CY90_9BILA|nr:unnamed protein product [Rotaria magnacalcarata]CAF2169299.1 unnamed protein product [Rotaria magnacalcarata]CAF4216003.1 unnamed protein product [Rotaria magnacalcarata]CAF4224950.1 unnamed protein product [Rotaria magnacalcarata]